MSDTDRDRWNQRYADGDYRPRTQPSPLLEEWLDRIPTSGRALDLACGSGRNALRMAEAGFHVDAVDISDVAISRGRAEAARRQLDIEWIEADLDDFEPEAGSYRLITMFRYRGPSLWPRLPDALMPGGFVIVEHHMQTHLEVDGPATDDHRLRPQELLNAFRELRILSYSEGLETSPQGSGYAIERIVACGGDPGF